MAKRCPSFSGEMRAQTNPSKCNFGLDYCKSTDAAVYRVSTDGKFTKFPYFPSIVGFVSCLIVQKISHITSKLTMDAL